MKIAGYLILAALAMIGCLTFEKPSYEVEVGHDATYRIGGNDPKEVKAGGKISSDGEPLLIEAPGKVSMLVYPAVDGEGQYALKLKDLDNWSGNALDKKLNDSLSKIMLKINEAQVKLSQNQPKAALALVKEAQKDYPGVTYLYFLEASCHYMSGNQVEAKLALAAALQDFPEHKGGRNLYQSLGGKLGAIQAKATGGETKK